jgi:hypothetical protein
MAAFGGLQLTFKGRNLQSKSQLGVPLNFTRIAIGDGQLNGRSIQELNSLVSEKVSLGIRKLKRTPDGRAVVGTVLENEDIIAGFYLREIGVFAQDPDEGEILYCYGNAGINGEYLAAGGGPDITQKTIDIFTLVGNASNVTATIDQSLVYATVEEFNTHVTDKNNPHAVTIEQIGAAPANHGHSNATTTSAGFMSPEEKAKMNNIAAGAEVNQNAFSNIKVGTTTVSAESKTDTLELAPGSNISLTPDTTNDRITFDVKEDAEHRFVTDLEKSSWNAKETPEGAQNKVNAHEGKKTNPHGVTKAQVGLPNVDNVQQATKTEFNSHNTDIIRHITNAERSSWNAKETPEGAQIKVNTHENRKNNPHNVTSEQVNLLPQYSKSIGDITYPKGASLVFVRSDEGWPSYGTVSTYRPYSTNYLIQYYYGYSTALGGDFVKYRRLPYGSETWESWVDLETTTGSQDKADNAEEKAKGASIPRNSTVGADIRLDATATERRYQWRMKDGKDAGFFGNNSGTLGEIGLYDWGLLKKIFSYNRDNFTVDFPETTLRSKGKIVETQEGAQAKATKAKNDATNWASGLSGSKIIDNRDISPLPSDYSNGRTTNEFKLATSVGLNSLVNDSYVHVFTERAWTDTSGGYVHQTAFEGHKNRVFTRVGNQETDVWEEWDELETTKGSQAKVDAHKNATAGAHKASAISVSDAKGHFAGSNVESVLDELFTNVSNGKTSIATAITDTDDSLVVSGNDSFSVLANAIRNINTGALSELRAGDTLIYMDRTETKINEASYFKTKEVQMAVGGTIRVSFGLDGYNPYYGYGRVYINGEPVGLERKTNSDYMTQYTEDFTVNEGDLVQIYAHNNLSGYVINVKDFSIGIDAGELTTGGASWSTF